MNEKIIEFAKTGLSRPYLEIDEGDDNLIFTLKNKVPFSKNLLLIKHRITGKRISLKFTNHKAVLKLEQLRNIEESGSYDVYLKISFLNHSMIYRVNFMHQNIGKTLFDPECCFYFDSYPTLHDNLSFSMVKSVFYPKVDSLAFENDGLRLNGSILIGDEVKFDTIEIVSHSNKGGRKVFSCDYEIMNSKVLFTSFLNNEFEEKEIDTSWTFNIRLKYRGIILNSSFLKCSKLSSYEKNEDRLYGKVDCAEVDGMNPCMFYFCNYRFEFKSNIITDIKYQNRIRIARRKDWYEKYKKDDLENNLIFFESFHGKYTSNPKYIYEKMLEMGLDKKYKIVWSYDGEGEIPGNPIIVRSDEEDYFKYLAHAKYKVSTATFPIIDSRRDIVFLQTWHGTPLKRLGSDISVKNSTIGWGHFNHEVPTWNYLVSANEFSTETFRRAFSFKKEMLEYGYPVNDIFYGDYSNLARKVKNKLNIADGKKIILYSPTFRDDKIDENGNRFFELELDLNYLHENLGDEYILIIKTHSVVSKSLELGDSLADFVIDCSDYEDIQELLIITDILITDYSSVFFDFAHTRKPILFFTPDMESYITSRGLYHEILQDLPGPQLINNKGILRSLLNIDKVCEDYKDKYDKFYDKYCSLGHGDAAERIVNKVFGGK